MTRSPKKVLPKEARLIEKIKACLSSGEFLDSYHAKLRQGEREVLRREIIFVLNHGYHEKARDKFDEHHATWNYSMRGKTIDGKDLRVVISFDKETMLIITVIELGK